MSLRATARSNAISPIPRSDRVPQPLFLIQPSWQKLRLVLFALNEAKRWFQGQSVQGVASHPFTTVNGSAHFLTFH